MGEHRFYGWAYDGDKLSVRMPFKRKDCKRNEKAVTPESITAVLSVVGRSANDDIAFSEEQRYAPECRKSDNGVNYTADKCSLTTEDPRNDIKAEQTYTAPVYASDNRKYQSDSVKHFNISFILSRYAMYYYQKYKGLFMRNIMLL